MKKAILGAIAAGGMLTLHACTLAKISGSGSIPIMLNAPQEKYKVVEHINIDHNVRFDYTASYDLYEILGKTLAGKDADAMINTRIHLKSDVDDYIINLITCGIASARTIHIEGDLIKYTGK